MNVYPQTTLFLLSLFSTFSLIHGQSATYSITGESFAPLSGKSSSTSYAQFSAVEPFGGLSVKNLPDFKNFVGLIGHLPPLDQDGDGISDVNEVALGTDKTKADTDGDGLTDGEEQTIGTNPLLSDSDGDGYSDYNEVNAQTDPNLATSNPNQAPVIPELANYENGSIRIPENSVNLPGYFNYFSTQHPFIDQNGHINTTNLDQYSKSLKHNLTLEMNGNISSYATETPWDLLGTLGTSATLPLLKTEIGFSESTTVSTDLSQGTLISEYNGTKSILINDLPYLVDVFKFRITLQEPHIDATYFERTHSSEVLVHEHLGVLGFTRAYSETFFDHSGNGGLTANQQSEGTLSMSTSSLGGINAYDPDGDSITWVIAEYGDSDLFTLSQTERLSYTYPQVSFKQAADFESPTDLNQDNIYDLILVATDGSLSTELPISIQIMDFAQEVSQPDNGNDSVNDDNEDTTQPPADSPLVAKTTTLAPQVYLKTANLYGEVASYTGGIPTETGFILSEDILFLHEESVSVINASYDSGNFTAEITDLEAGKTYYTRAFASFENDPKKFLGKLQRIKIEKPMADFFDAMTATAGWYQSDWFGTFKRANDNWIYHEELTWLYVASSDSTGSWFWSDKLGWGWTRKDLWPYIWTNNPEGWVYFFGNKDETLTFWDYTNGKYLKL
jgi:hypothetical protein